VGYKPHHSKHSPAPLQTEWEYKELQVARFWGLQPSEFESCDADDKAKMMAFFFVNNELENYYHGEIMRNIDKDKPKTPDMTGGKRRKF